MKYKSVALIGASGRMGLEIERIICDRDGWDIGYKVGLEPGLLNSVDKIVANEVDIVVDFSHISMFQTVVHWCVLNSKPLISGTTGLEADHHSLIEQASKEIPILWAPNMSVGVAWMTEAIKALSALAQDFDFQIEELHHNKKVDSPSGTAKHLQRVLNKAVGGKAPEPLAVRGGGIYGIHKVWSMSEDEVITIEHQALNRTVFAQGAVKAMMWLADQGPGKYEIKDVLGL